MLPERANLAPWPGGWIAVGRSGSVAVLDDRLAIVARTEAAAVDAAMTAAGLVTVGRDGAAVAEAAGWRHAGMHLACHRHGDGDAVWLAARHGVAIELAVRDAQTGAVRCATTIDDRFGAAAVMLSPGPDPRSVVVWLAAGQDGQATWVARADGGAIALGQLADRDQRPAVFAPAGDSYLCWDDLALRQRSWPDDEDLDEVRWYGDDDDGADDDDAPGSYAVHLPGGYAAWLSMNGALRLVDLSIMRAIGELAISGGPVEQVVAAPDGTIATVHAGGRLVLTRAADWSPDAER